MKAAAVVPRLHACPSRGYALIMAMIFLLLLSGIAVAMLRSSGFQARIAGNVLDKMRAQQLAEASLLYAERLLSQDGSATADTCTGVLQANSLPRTPVCDATLTDATTLPWPQRVDYLPPGLPLRGSTSAPQGSPAGFGYAAAPAFHIAWLGYSSNSDRLFLVTAVGYGGNASSASVVRSVYVLSTDTRCGDCP